ncbi:hypothetical protein [Defluviimonas sp. WL0050]|uniref:hypothetical protein n=1 Tax=Albidovulum litorale TaxID=2984134 RepID=UPI0021E7AF48|nr:hypothetical protein [Defluviimonas sp. WL0050]
MIDFEAIMIDGALPHQMPSEPAERESRCIEKQDARSLITHGTGDSSAGKTHAASAHQEIRFSRISF